MSKHPDMYGDIHEFHTKFGHTKPDAPVDLEFQTWEYRRRFMQEELSEYCEGFALGDLEKQLDGLVDLVYVALGTAFMHGFNFDEAWRRVHAANMKKERATHPSQSKRGNVLDVIKPPGWTAPDLSDLV
jgi:predicted HAD superfamily Cof-like phosphohydrolase